MSTTKAKPRILSFAPTFAKPQSVKAPPTAAETHRAARLLIDHIQVLLYDDPDAIFRLQESAAMFRRLAQQWRL